MFAIDYLKKNSDLIQEFRAAADRVTRVAEHYGIKVRGYGSADLPLYSKLSREQQEVALQLIALFADSFEAAIDHSRQPPAEERFLWSALSKMGMVPPSELFSLLKQGAVIEIYNLENLQIWRNFSCFQYCSYSLEEVYSLPVFTRYWRSPEKLEECLTKVNELLSGRAPDVFFPEIEKHKLIETCSEGCLVLEVHHELFCKLKDRNGTLCAWLVMSSAELLGSSEKHPKPEYRENLYMLPSDSFPVM